VSPFPVCLLLVLGGEADADDVCAAIDDVKYVRGTSLCCVASSSVGSSTGNEPGVVDDVCSELWHVSKYRSNVWLILVHLLNVLSLSCVHVCGQ